MDDSITETLQLRDVFCNQRAKEALAVWRELDNRPPQIALVTMPADEPSALRAVDEFDRAVVAQNHAIREVADGSSQVVRRSSDHLQKLILLSLNAMLLRRNIAKT
jgi:hypothetical protein